MVTKELLLFIEQELLSQKPETFIRNVLSVKGGWRDPDIDEAIALVKRQNNIDVVAYASEENGGTMSPQIIPFNE